MSNELRVAEHYGHGALLAAIEAALGALGKSRSDVTCDDLGPVDEFHIGGRAATEHLLDPLGFASASQVLDVGCGLGGAARFAASTYGCRVTGIDLTGEYIETGRALNRWVGLDERISLHTGNALAMPFEDESFDGAYMLHVGMNIEDKALLFRELHRVLRPGARLAVYDLMRRGPGALAFPVPWAAGEPTSHVASPESYRGALTAAGLAVECERGRRDFAVEFFQLVRERNRRGGGPGPLGLHTLMQGSTEAKLRNMVENVVAGRIEPIEMIAGKSP